MGSSHWNRWSTWVGVLGAGILFLLLFLLIERHPVFISTFGNFTLGERLGIEFTLGARGRLYQHVLALAVSVSEISLLQLGLIFVVITWVSN